MKHIIYADSDRYPVALLIKASAFNSREIKQTYVTNLVNEGIPESDIVSIALDYNTKDKAPVAFIKEVLEVLLPEVDALGVSYLYCADAHYFKVLSGCKKAEPFLGYSFPCAIKGYEHIQVVLGINHKSLMYNPANEGKLMLSLQTLGNQYKGIYSLLGADIIEYAHYPDTIAGIKETLEALHQFPKLSCDIEAGSLDFDKAGIGTISFAWNKHEGVGFACDYVPFPEGVRDGFHGELVHNPQVKALLKQFFEAYQGELTYHKSTYDIKVLIYELWMKNLLDTSGLLTGLKCMTRSFQDTKVIAYLGTNTTAGNSLSLKDLAHPFAGNWAQSDDDIKDIRRIPLPQLLQYNLVDCLATNYVSETYTPIMVQDGQEDLYYGLMLPSQKSIIQIELTGMPLCPKSVAEVRTKLEIIVDECTQSLNSMPVVTTFNLRLRREAMEAANAKLKVKQHPIEAFKDVVFNPNSGPQKQKLLFEEMGLPVIDLTKGKGAATGGETLDKLVNHTDNSDYIEILNALNKYGKAEKILSSFIPAFEKAIVKDGAAGVVWLHGNFNLGGTKSGRLSSSDPNLQNIPASSTFSKLIKGCFQAPDGWVFCGADFNSLEDYISALTTKDPNKLKVYLDGYDGHSLRAYTYWPDKFPDIVNTVESINSIKVLYEPLRGKSKAPTFALTYQGTYITLMNKCGFSESEAKSIEFNFKDLYKVSIEWVEDKLEGARKDGYVTLAFGLRLRTPLLARTIGNHRTTPYQAAAEGRTAGNALGQSYGLLNNRACNEFMERVWNSPYRLDIKPAALIHDAIYLLIREHSEVVQWVNKNLIECMQWQDLPELEHDKVKLGAELDLFWPSWAHAINIPNGATQSEILSRCANHMEKLQEAA